MAKAEHSAGTPRAWATTYALDKHREVTSVVAFHRLQVTCTGSRHPLSPHPHQTLNKFKKSNNELFK